MKVLYFHQYFRKPEEGGAIRSYYLAMALQKAGHEVIVITAHAQTGTLRERYEGLDIRYLPVPYSNHFSLSQRLRAFWKFVRLAIREAFQEQEVDLCYLSSTPLTVGLIGLWLRRRKGWPYLFEVRDLWPEAPIQLGAIPWPWLQSILYALEKRIYRRAEVLVALSPGMKAGIERQNPLKPVHLVPNMADIAYFPSSEPREAIEVRYGLPHQFRILYAGAMGKANGLEALIRLAAHYEGEPVQFLLVGDGSERTRLEVLAAGMPQVSFLNPVNKSGIRDLLAASDAAYVSFAQVPILQTNSPNKFFDALAAGRPVLVTVDGWLRELVELQGCGAYLDPQSPVDAKQTLEQFRLDPARLQAAQMAARELAETQFSREKLCQKVVELVEGLERPRESG